MVYRAMAADRGRVRLAPRFSRIVVPMLTALLAFTGGCTGSSPDQQVQVHQDGEGQLLLKLGDGLNAVNATEQSPRTITFGAGNPCSTSGDKLTIESVDFEIAVKPLSMVKVWREVPDASERTPDGNWEGVISINGTPTEPTDKKALSGEMTTDIAGQEVSHNCSGDENQPFTELLVVVTVDGGGAWLKGVDVTYTGKRRTYKVHSGWNFIVCGTKTTASEGCH